MDKIEIGAYYVPKKDYAGVFDPCHVLRVKFYDRSVEGVYHAHNTNVTVEVIDNQLTDKETRMNAYSFDTFIKAFEHGS